MDNKYIIKEAYGVIPPDAMTINEMLYYMCAYIKEHAVKGDTGETGATGVGITDVQLVQII